MNIDERKLDFCREKGHEMLVKSKEHFQEAVAYIFGLLNEGACKKCQKISRIRITSEQLSGMVAEECGYSVALISSLIGFLKRIIISYEDEKTVNPDPRILSILDETVKKLKTLEQEIDYE